MNEPVRPAVALSRDLQVFSSASDAPRVRWRTDLVAAAFLAAALTVLVIVAGTGAQLDDDALEFVGSLPGWFRWFGQASYVVAVVYSIGLLIGVGVFAKGRIELFRDMVLAAVAAAVVAALLSQYIDDRWPEIALFDLQQTRTTFPTFTITSVVAIQAAAAPHLTLPIRRLGWTAIIAGPVASILGGVTTISDALGGVLVGLLVASLVRYLFGTTAGLPSIGRVRRGLDELGLVVDDLRYHVDQHGPALALTGTVPGGDAVLVNVLGSDAWNSRQLARWWRRAWYQDVGEQYSSDRRQQVEHEALVMYVANSDRAPVPDVVAVGMSTLDDAFLVTTHPRRTLDDLAPGELTAEVLAELWSAVATLHAAGVSHGSIDARDIWLTDDQRLELSGFADAALHPTDEQRWGDIASTLVATTLRVGPDDAIAAARSGLGDDAVKAMLPMLQTASLSAPLRQEAKQEKLSISDLRSRTAQAVGVDVPRPQQLTRVSWGSLLMTAFVAFAVYTVIGGLADVGFDTIAETLGDARWGLVLLGLMLAQATNYTDAVALVKIAPKPVPVGITTVEQFAIGFVNMAVPSAAGRIATNARYFQKFGISPVTSAASGAITGFLGFIAQVVLIVLTVVVGSGSIDISSLEGGGEVLRLVAMVGVIAVIAAIVIAVVRPWRHWVVGHIRGPVSQTKMAFETLRNPRIAIKAFGAAFATEVLYGAGFAACVLSMGGSITLGEALFINVAVSLFAGLMPIPGGIGVTEAGLTAGLAAIGVPTETAVSAVLVWRLVSYYLPPVWGYVSLRWLTKHDYL
jgi:uncharacterized membrane protein YbhN (UPF0104 family)